jgi:hypothetical protein
MNDWAREVMEDYEKQIKDLESTVEYLFLQLIDLYSMIEESETLSQAQRKLDKWNGSNFELIIEGREIECKIREGTSE